MVFEQISDCFLLQQLAAFVRSKKNVIEIENNLYSTTETHVPTSHTTPNPTSRKGIKQTETRSY